ncbi:hypothetical protein FDP41_005705 [Naegleria fowleri]|uniref:Uncharacterized protein n=1 Tax=Naegleria fowleri TaxID=5763 RepID=A0A6A5BJA4_NAEFO|nr:uncharacterized protein FDP41_005705 [Naegleria fowleri]KAF0974952.1 hypothetical protein FDP41_005705 [Naegleria fowleri]CAG4708265.1 unnamed protein product [Naegleria fowleri]
MRRFITKLVVIWLIVSSILSLIAVATPTPFSLSSSSVQHKQLGYKNILILCLPFAGHVTPHIELVESLAHREKIGNVTFANIELSKPFIRSLIEKINAVRMTQASNALSKIHIHFFNDDNLEFNTPARYEQITTEMDSVPEDKVHEIMIHRLLVPYQRLLLHQLEIVEVHDGRLLKVLALGTPEALSNTEQVKRFVRIKEDPSQTLFEYVVVDNFLTALSAIVAKYNIACTKIFSSIMNDPLRHPTLNAPKLEYFTNFIHRLKIPLFIKKDLEIINRIRNGIGNHYFDLGDLKSSDTKCTRIQTSSLGLNYASSSTQQPNSFLVGAFISHKNLQLEVEKLNHLSLDSENLEYYRIVEWMNDQHEILLAIFGSTMKLKESELKELLEAFHNSLKHTTVSIVMALSSTNLINFTKLRHSHSFMIDNLLSHPRFKLLTNFVPQKALLSFQNVKVMITHCGAGSVNEAIYFGKRLIGIPYDYDQFRVSNMIQETRVGISIVSSKEEKGKWTSDTVYNAITTILFSNESETFRIQVHKMQTLSRYAGGVERAAEIIEMMAQLEGDLSWAVVDKHLTWYQFFFIDVIGFYLAVIVSLIIAVCRFGFRCYCCKKNGNLKKHVNTPY